MARNRKDYNLLSLSPETGASVVKEFNDLEEVSAKLLYADILKAVKEATTDDKIGSLKNLSKVLDEISKIKNDEYLTNCQNSDDIGNFNIVALACKNKAIKVLEYILSEESRTLYNLSTKISGHKNESLLSVKDEFYHNAYYYAIRSNMTDLLSLLVNRWQDKYEDELLDDHLSQSYKELKLRNVLLTKEMQLFVQSKILDLRFFHASTAENSGTGNSWHQIKKRIEMVIRFIQSVKNDYWEQDPDEKFIFIAEFIAKSIHVLKYLLKSTYDRLPWEEIEFCLIIFIRCCKNPYEQNLVYNSVLNKKQMLMHLFNFSIVLDTQHSKFENSNVMRLAKPLKLHRDSVIEKITENNNEFRGLYDDYEKIRDFCSLEIMKCYADLVESSDATEKQRHLLVSRVLQVMGEHMKNTLDSPKLSSSTASILLSSLSSNTREIITELRDSLSHEETLFVRNEIEKKSYLFKNIQSDIPKIKVVILDILYSMRIASVKSLLKKVNFCKSNEDIKDYFGPYRHSFDLHSKQIANTNLNSSIKKDIERLEDMVLCLHKNINDKAIWEKMLCKQIYELIQEEKERFQNLKREFVKKFKIVSYVSFCVSSGNQIQTKWLTNGCKDFPLKEPSLKIKDIKGLMNVLLKRYDPMIFTAEKKELRDIIRKIEIFMKFEMGSLKWIEEFRYIMRRNANKESRRRNVRQDSSDNLFETKRSQLKETLIDFDLMDDTSIEDFSSFESNMELRAITEMLVLDILCILENLSSRNPFYLDKDYPLLAGKNLRNHLAHGNALIDVIFENSTAQFLANAKKILETVSLNNNKEMDKIINCDSIKLENCINYELQIMSNQKKLFVALGEGNMKDVEECLNKGADVYGRDHYFSTCLHYAGKAPDCAAMKWILKQGLSTNAKNTTGESVLHMAAWSNRVEIIKYLVDHEHMSLDIRDVNGKTPLHVAVENKTNEVVQYISKLDINIKRKDKNAFTPLHIAIERNNFDAAKILLDKETNVDENEWLMALHLASLIGNLTSIELLIAKTSMVDSKSNLNFTPLHIAAFSGFLEIVRTLVKSGAAVNWKDEIGITPLQSAACSDRVEILDFLIQHGADVNASDYLQVTPLMKAADSGHARSAEILLQSGAIVNAKDNKKNTPLHFASFEGHYEMVELLLNHEAIIDCRNYGKQTGLHLSSAGGHKKIVELLICRGADINATDSTNSTPLHLAAWRGHGDIVDLLLNKGADINCKDEIEITPLHYAAFNADRGIVESLLNKGADIRACSVFQLIPLSILIIQGLSEFIVPEMINVYSSDHSGFTLLHEAAVAGDLKLVKYCIENNCDINARTHWRSTALHFAAEFDFPEIVKLLLNKGAKIDAKNGKGCSPLFLAVEYNCEEVVKVLVSHDVNYLKSKNDDKIQVLKQSVTNGYVDIVIILLQNIKFGISNDIKQCLLNIAIHYNHKNLVTTLLEKGFKLKDDARPLHTAVERRLYDMAELLLLKGVNPNNLDENNCTPLHMAVKMRDIDMVEILLSSKTDIRIKSNFLQSVAKAAVRENQLDIIKLFLELKVIDANFKGNNGYTLLHTSALSKSLDVTRYLVAEGANINAKDKKNRKPVHIAVEKGFEDMVEFYLNCNDLEYESAELLFFAAKNDKANICDFLLGRNPDMNGIHLSDATLMDSALLKGHKDVFFVLLHYGAYYNEHSTTLLELSEDNEAASLLRKVEKLFTSVKKNKPSEVEKLLKDESDSKYCLANAKCVKKETVLHYASWKGYEEIVDVLLKYNTNPNPRTKTGKTPLHYAVNYSHFSIVKALLTNGAIYNALSQIEKTPLDYATNRKIRDFLLFLNSSFTKVQYKDLSVLENLIRIDEDMKRAVIKAKNREGKTLIEVAYIYGFWKIVELQEIFESDLTLELTSAKTFFQERKYDEAFSALERILRKLIAIFGADSQPVLDVKTNLAVVAQKKGDLDKALRLSQEVYKIRKTCLGEEHLKTLLAKTDIAVSLSDMGKTEESLRIFEAIHIKLKDKLQPDDFIMMDFEYRYSITLYKMKKIDKVLKLNYAIQQKCAQIKEYEHQILLADSLFITAVTLRRQEKLLEAKEFFEKTYEIRRNVLAPHNFDTLRTLLKIAEVLTKLGFHDGALEKIEEVLDFQKFSLPENHYDILESEFMIGAVIYSQGRSLKALKCLLSLELKVAVVAPDSELMKNIRDRIATLKQELPEEYEYVFDQVQKQN